MTHREYLLSMIERIQSEKTIRLLYAIAEELFLSEPTVENPKEALV